MPVRTQAGSFQHIRRLETRIQFRYAMDVFTVDTVLGKRSYVFAIISPTKHGRMNSIIRCLRLCPNP